MKKFIFNKKTLQATLSIFVISFLAAAMVIIYYSVKEKQGIGGKAASANEQMVNNIISRLCPLVQNTVSVSYRDYELDFASLKLTAVDKQYEINLVPYVAQLKSILLQLEEYSPRYIATAMAVYQGGSGCIPLPIGSTIALTEGYKIANQKLNTFLSLPNREGVAIPDSKVNIPICKAGETVELTLLPYANLEHYTEEEAKAAGVDKASENLIKYVFTPIYSYDQTVRMNDTFVKRAEEELKKTIGVYYETLVTEDSNPDNGYIIGFYSTNKVFKPGKLLKAVPTTAMRYDNILYEKADILYGKILYPQPEKIKLTLERIDKGSSRKTYVYSLTGELISAVPKKDVSFDVGFIQDRHTSGWWQATNPIKFTLVKGPVASEKDLKAQMGPDKSKEAKAALKEFLAFQYSEGAGMEINSQKISAKTNILQTISLQDAIHTTAYNETTGETESIGIARETHRVYLDGTSLDNLTACQ